MENCKQKKGLFGSLDPIGMTLSFWRTLVIGNLISKSKDQKLVDLACGDNRLKQHLGFGIGVDIADYGQVDIVHKDFSNLPFETDSVDIVTILASLNYFDSPIDTLKDIRRLLKPEGLLIVTFLNQNISKYWHKLRDRNLKKIAFNKKELSELLEQSGLRIERDIPFMFGVNHAYLIRKI